MKMRNRYKTEAEKRADYLGYQRGYHAGIKKSVRHGRWIENETSYADSPIRQTCNCSVCGLASTRPLGDWCRWCGAKMDEVDNENPKP